MLNGRFCIFNDARDRWAQEQKKTIKKLFGHTEVFPWLTSPQAQVSPAPADTLRK